jgi:hypothetical protein
LWQYLYVVLCSLSTTPSKNGVCSVLISRVLYRPAGASKQPPTAQLTIFYAGMVNVYDDVPFDKVSCCCVFSLPLSLTYVLLCLGWSIGSFTTG